MTLDLLLRTRRWCYYVDLSQDTTRYGGYVPSVVIENEPGHFPLLGRGEHAAPWVWGSTPAAAQAACDRVNAQRGIDAETAAIIVVSSMTARESALDIHSTRR